MKTNILLLVFLTNQIFAQEIDITSALKQIENGNIQNASKILMELKSKDMNDPSVIFLDAMLTKDGDEALRKYSTVLEKYPDSKYADASLYRIFSYYYSLGYYKKAESYLNRLKKDFPESQYIKTADRKIPDIEEPSAQTVSEPQIQQPAQQKKIEAKEYNFTIQAGAFLNVDNAKKLSDQLKKENYFTEITTKEVGGSILNVVNVGKFTNEEETKPVLNFLENKFNLKGRVVPINQ
jgi:tetratricopeptide (TPR) repeat protein